MNTREQMEKAKEVLDRMDNSTWWQNLDDSKSEYTGDSAERRDALSIALSAIQSLLDAGEVLPPLKNVDKGSDMETLASQDREYECFKDGYNLARSEDIAIVAKKCKCEIVREVNNEKT